MFEAKQHFSDLFFLLEIFCSLVHFGIQVIVVIRYQNTYFDVSIEFYTDFYWLKSVQRYFHYENYGFK